MEAFEKPITIFIMTHNNADTISLCLKRLEIQNLTARVVIMDYNSKDGTREMLKKQIKVDYYKFPIELILINKKMDKHKAKVHFRTEACKKCDTDYLMFLTADLLIPRFSIQQLINIIENGDRIGVAGLQYQNVDHIQYGATIILSELAKKIDWDLKTQCTCRNARDIIKGLGFQLVNHPILSCIRIREVVEW